MDGIIYSDPQGDRGDDVGAEVEFGSRYPHESEEHKERKDVRDHGDEPNPGGQKHGRHEGKDDCRAQRQALDLSTDNVTGRVREEDQVAGGMDAEFRGEMSPGKCLDLIHQGGNVAGTRERGAYQDDRARVIRVVDDARYTRSV